jgi:uncharacterized membrane protein YccF (DUF307 family)
MTMLLNIIWLLLSGIWLCISYIFLGLAFCITIVGIPLGLASINIGIQMLMPFGKSVVPKAQTNSGCVTSVLTLIWLIFAGLPLAFGHLLSGILLCITIIGIPLGLQNFKFIQLALQPYQYELK